MQVNGASHQGRDSEVASSLTSGAAEFQSLLHDLTPILVEYWNDCLRDDTRVYESVPPRTLEGIMNLELPEQALPRHELLRSIRDILRYNSKIGSGRYLDKMVNSVNPAGSVAELVTGVLNPNGHVFNSSQTATLAERALIRRIRTLLEMPDVTGTTTAVGGVMCPGGSMSNLLAVVTARNALHPETRKHGSGTKQLVMIASESCHYSITKAAMIIGLGTEGVKKVKCDENGRMRIDELRKTVETELKEGRTPFFVNGTAGTTVSGAFDPLDEIAQVCKEFNLWYHIDGAWGGSLIFSEKHGHYVTSGSKYCDSFTIDAHKGLGVPTQCSALLTRQPDVLQRSNSLQASYLFHGDSYDLGEGGLGCGRRGDSLKWFISWQYHGTRGFRSRVDKAMDNAACLRQKLRDRDEFYLVFDHEGLNVCFYYLPPSLRHLKTVGREEFIKNAPDIGGVTTSVHAEILKRGNTIYDYAPQTQMGLQAFFRIPFNSDRVEEKHLNLVIDEALEVGRQLYG